MSEGATARAPGIDLEVTRYDVTDHVATVTLDRPERLNAWTPRMQVEYRTLLATAADDPAVRVIVVTGAGRGFCAGADTDALAGHASKSAYAPEDAASLPAPGFGVRPEFDAEFAFHFGIPKPIIAAVNGPAAGFGFVLACFCDLRFAVTGAKLTTAHGRLGLPCPFGLSWLLPRLVGLTRAVDLTFTSRTFLAEEAVEMGLFSATLRPDHLLPHVYDYAQRLATEASPASLAATKAQLYADLHRDVASSVRDAEARVAIMARGPDYAEGVAAVREKRPPRFEDLGPAKGVRSAMGAKQTQGSEKKKAGKTLMEKRSAKGEKQAAKARIGRALPK